MRGFVSFLPLRRVRRQWSDRIKILEEPVFPGYLFCRIDLSHRLRVLNAPGVAQIVGVGRSPVPICETEIRSIQTLVASRLHLSPSDYISVGQRIRIDRGPLAGVEGIVTQAENGKPRVVVAVTLLNRAVSAEIERDWIAV